MLETIIITIIICFIVFELIEHVFIPLFFFILRGKKKSNYGVMGMIGKVVEIKRWNKTEGQVLVNGELWNAVCEISLQEGSKAVILGIEGLTLKLKPYEN
ncbi:MAG: NfeD family protein [Deltaproteobacteria bacterium]|nr:NfeD family protein [Deltaproteobacteria bacterium]